MSRVAYVDGQYLPHRFAAVHIEDRGCRFADRVYDEEVHVTEGASINPWIVERSFRVAEARSAREALLTSTTAELLPVVKIDGEPVGGVPGPITLRLRELYLVHAAAAA